MKQTTRFVACVLAGVLIFSGNVFGGCGGKGGKGKEGGHGGGHGGVGIGGSVDLGGVGQRKREADPFAVSEGSSTSQSHDRSRTKKNETNTGESNPFIGVKLTGKKAKNVASSDNSATTSPKE